MKDKLWDLSQSEREKYWILFTVGNIDRSRDIGRYSGRHSVDTRSTLGQQSVDTRSTLDFSLTLRR